MVGSTPSEHADSRITRAGALMDLAAAIPHGYQDEKRSLFGDAWLIVLPQLRALAKRRLGGDDLLDDVLSYTAQKLWRAVQTGYTPKHGYEAILPSTPARAAATIIKRNQKHRDNPTHSLEFQLSGREGETLMDALDIPGEDSTAQAIANVEHAHLRKRLTRASRRAGMLGNTLAARILHHGLEDTTADTARMLDAEAKDVAIALEWITEHHYALLVVSDPRFVEHLDDAVGGVQMDLFGMVMSA